MTEPEDFYERQTSKDCSVHSLNNAWGKVVVTPEEVASEIDRRVEAFKKTLSSLVLNESDVNARVKTYEKGLSKDDTFFSAEAVWYAAVGLGRMGIPERLDSDSDDPLTKKLSQAMLSRERLIFLGKGNDGESHAVGARFGKIYDSLNDGPAVPLTDENLRKIYKEILGIFAF